MVREVSNGSDRSTGNRSSNDDEGEKPENKGGDELIDAGKHRKESPESAVVALVSPTFAVFVSDLTTIASSPASASNKNQPKPVAPKSRNSARKTQTGTYDEITGG